MERSEIDIYLVQIRNKANQKNTAELLNELEKVSVIKPLTLLFFNVKAKLLCELGRYQDAIDILNTKINLMLPDKECIESCKIYQQAFKAFHIDVLYHKFLNMEYYLRIALYGDEFASNCIKESEIKTSAMEESFLRGESGMAEALYNTYFELLYMAETTIMGALLLKSGNGNSDLVYENAGYETNHSFLLDTLLNRQEAFVLSVGNEQCLHDKVLIKALVQLNQKVWVIMPSISAEVKNNVAIKDTVAISMGNLETDETGAILVRPVELVFENGKRQNNLDFVLEEIAKTTTDDFCMLLGSNMFFTSLNEMPSAKKRMQCLSGFWGDSFDFQLLFGYFGSYLSYISRIYGINAKAQVEKDGECEFSIVIPVRNSSDSLRYTLNTCLEQRDMNDGDYEIIVSDNSNTGYDGVKNLVDEIGSQRIRYLRTPRELPLCKSFEYAFLQAKGNFIFSLGADDAVLPWGLQVIREALKSLPNEDVLQWDRGFFVWSNNKKIPAQAGQFSIPRPYKRGDIKIAYTKSPEMLFTVLNRPDDMYGMPMLYINSGFRRRYITRLLERTGRLWDGYSQDIYMGVVDLTLNDTIPYIQYPLTIAGMTDSSEGITSNRGEDDERKVLKKLDLYRSFGVSVPNGKGMNFAFASQDVANFYASFFRVMDFDDTGILEAISSRFDWKIAFKTVVERLACDDNLFDFYLTSIRFSAYHQSDELGKWFDDNLLKSAYLPKTITTHTEKSYFEGFLPQGGIQLDARKFGVENIHQATKLFENISNL